MRVYRVVGRVQGVGFREWTRRTADAMGLVGSVRNRPDGSVEVQVSGPDDALARLEKLLETGPPAAQVERVERLPPADGAMPVRGFRVLYS
ncbi:MAG: acylphosphatase [Gemmatimonadales bacterium]